jgi:peptidoglycan/LPS O-acetylase OafA/YrhL
MRLLSLEPAKSNEETPTRARLQAVDGLRVLAVFGIIWAHLWSFVFAAPTLLIKGVDVARLGSLFGSGVNLFFVISGFCMYRMFAASQQHFSAANYWNFVRNRFLRIAPAYYVCIFATILWCYVQTHAFAWRELFGNMLFLNTMPLPYTKPWLIFHFWSLSTEWHFYLLLPIFIAASARFGFVRTWSVFFAIALPERVNTL